MGLTILGIFCLLWAVAAAIIAITKPTKIWQTGKISGFVKLLGTTGTVVMMLVLAVIVAGLGIWLTFLM